MTFQNPAFIIPRQSVVGVEGVWVKVFDPTPASPPTPELLNPTNPVPEVMQAADAAGLLDPVNHQPIGFKVSLPHTIQRQLLHGLMLPTWDGLKVLMFFVFTDPDNPATNNGNYPAATIRVPRGVVFHSKSHGDGPPPHTIHWHGIEPTSINDGVGHCSMEIGDYTYQWQPNNVGTYFYHCHRNTPQHFEFGLFGLLIYDPPDAFFASIASINPDGTVNLNNIPIGAGNNGLFRTEANTAAFPQFPGFVPGDPINGVRNGNPNAFSVPYDVEAFWVLDDRDSVWSDLAQDARATFPKHGNVPGVNDEFHDNPGQNGFFAFNDFNPDYFFITGVPVQAHVPGGVGIIDPAGASPAGGGLPGGLIPAALNSGKAGTQVAINAKVGQTVLIRILDAAYADTRIILPVDAVVIAFDGRALGVPPFGLYNAPFLLPAGTPIGISTARRFDVLIRTTAPVNTFATVDFLNTRGETLLVTAKIPFVVT